MLQLRTSQQNAMASASPSLSKVSSSTSCERQEIPDETTSGVTLERWHRCVRPEEGQCYTASPVSGQREEDSSSFRAAPNIATARPHSACPAAAVTATSATKTFLEIEESKAPSKAEDHIPVDERLV